MLFCGLIMEDVETGQSMCHVELCGHHPVIMIEKDAWNLSVGHFGYLHIWVLVCEHEIGGVLVIEMGEIFLIGKGDVACSFVSFVIEPGMRVAVEDGSDVYAVNMGRDRDLLQAHTHISCRTGQIGGSIVGASLCVGTILIDNFGL
jgi:hypothetical protein